MKQLILIMALVLSINAYAQDANKTVTLVVSGQGKTQDEAKQNALRNAIEQAFGTFISSKTEILNDELVKDQIVSVSNGNIQKFEVISEVQIPNGGYATSLKATVSVTKLTSFVESKGVNVEFKGSLFAFNVNQQILNEKNEIKAIDDLCKIVRTLADMSFDYTISVSDPIAVNASNEKWRIPMYISVYTNNNIQSIANHMNHTLKSLSLSNDEVINYINLGKFVFPISFAANENNYNYIILRKEESIFKLINVLFYFNHPLQNFKISNGLNNWKISDFPKKITNIYDYNFRLFLEREESISAGNRQISYPKPSVFFKDAYRGTKMEPNADTYSSSFKPILDYKELKISSSLIVDNYNDFHNRKNWSRVGMDQDAKYYFKNEFAFVKKLKDIGRQQTGVAISFIGVYSRKEVVRFYYEDILSLAEINKIKEYKVIPIGK